MKNTLSNIYEQILLNEAEKNSLQNPSHDEVGNLKTKQDAFGTKPKPVEGPERASLNQGPKYEQSTGNGTKMTSTAKNSSMPHSSGAKEHKPEKGKEMEDTKVDPTKHEDEEEDEEDTKKKKTSMNNENFTMSAFETLFKKTISEEMEEEFSENSETAEMSDISSDEDLDLEDTETEEEMEDEDEEGDLISDLKDLQDKLANILDKLEGAMEENEDSDLEDSSYTEEDFDEEFDDEETDEEAMKESVDKPKALNDSKGKHLTKKKNKVGRINPKKGKANQGSLKCEPEPKTLGDKKSALQKGRSEVKSSVKKGEFIK